MVKNTALIINIDTATTTASVSLSMDGNLLQERVNPQSIDHAAWIHSAIESMMQGDNHTYQLRDVDAVAVVAGPGSYTGLRVGMATAKGLCYGLNIPLISLNTLRVMAYATNKATPGAQLLCPMLDARRMEVFTALYDTALNELIAPCAMILDEQSFSTWLNKQEIVFFGNGSNKWKTLIQHANAVFSAAFYTAADIACMSNDAFRLQDFCNLAYTEPIYLKDFYTLKKLTP